MDDHVRLMVDGPAPGIWNMAVDEALLRRASATGRRTVRFYSWAAPTLSLGYFQSIQQRDRHPASQSCPVVRRSSGGGAILHDAELTYSLTAPISTRDQQSAQFWYGLFHDTLIEALAEFGIQATACQATDSARESQFLCFQRRSAGDILLGPSKIAGSAQRRHAQAILQHGSLLLGRSVAAPELDGIAELAGRAVGISEFTTAWSRRLAARWGVSWEPGRLTFAETDLAHRIAAEKFGADSWTQRR